MPEMVIDSIRVSLMNYQRVVILKELVSREGEVDRYLPIWIGPAEADAIAVKLQGVLVRTEVPIYVADEVLAKAGITLDEEGKPVLPEDRAGADKPAEVREEDLRRMSAFTDFISTLDLENLGETSGQGT